jgi:uncharacterized membrane protein affecting hemolysin expression
VIGREAVLLLLLAVLGRGPAFAQAARVWEVNGIRLEAAQVERLASDIAEQTVVAVGRLAGLALRAEQSQALESIYHAVALDTYDEVVRVVNREDLAEAAKEAEVKRLVIEGQEHSSARVAEVLDAGQYAAYRAWEQKQVEAFRQRGLWSSRSRRGGR